LPKAVGGGGEGDGRRLSGKDKKNKKKKIDSPKREIAWALLKRRHRGRKKGKAAVPLEIAKGLGEKKSIKKKIIKAASFLPRGNAVQAGEKDDSAASDHRQGEKFEFFERKKYPTGRAKKKGRFGDIEMRKRLLGGGAPGRGKGRFVVEKVWKRNCVTEGLTSRDMTLTAVPYGGEE